MPVPTLLAVRDLSIAFGDQRVVSDVGLTVRKGETVTLVGESGSGKTVTALAIMGLLPPAARVVGGSILHRGEDLRRLPAVAMTRRRGREIGMIFQEPRASLDPVFAIGAQVAEVLRLHHDGSRRDVRRRGLALLESAELPDPARCWRAYPHELSGGMCQRVGLALALAGEPDLIIADEPTTALDVTTQRQILALLAAKRDERGLGLLLITHDLGIVSELADFVCVLFQGRLVETAPVGTVFDAPCHPYTQGLLAAVPRLDDRRDRLPSVPAALDPAHRIKLSGQEVTPWWPGQPDYELREVEPGHRCAVVRENA